MSDTCRLAEFLGRRVTVVATFKDWREGVEWSNDPAGRLWGGPGKRLNLTVMGTLG